MKWKKFSEEMPKPERLILYSNGIVVWDRQEEKERNESPRKKELAATHWMYIIEIPPSKEIQNKTIELKKFNSSYLPILRYR